VERWGRLPHVVLTGRPNAGKSTLLNRLSGQERAIAAPIAGTTRDVLSAPLRFDGSECLLIDAAGISTAADELDQMAQCAAARAVEEADLVLHLVDVREASPGSQSGISAYGAPWVAVLTKVDLVEPKRAASVQVEIEQRTGVEVYLASAVTGAGCDALVESISAALRERSSDGAADSMALIGAHHEALVAAREALGRAIEIAGASMDSLENADLVAMELHAAATELGRLVGKDLPDDLLGRIFARFCVGK
jgi:tRNA modification GTPase